MTLSTNVSGTWKTVSGVYVNVLGTWKTVQYIHTNVNGVWKEVYAATNGCDAYTVLLIHGDGPDGSTVFADSSYSGHKITTYGNTQVSSTSKFGTGSIVFDGNGDYLRIADSADWFFDTGDFTIDLWARWTALPTSGKSQVFMSQRADGYNGWRFIVRNDSGTYKLRFFNEIGEVTTIDIDVPATLAINTWYHIALVRNGNNFMMFLDGTQVGNTVTNASGQDNFAAKLSIGEMGGASYFNGRMDEIRVSKGIARWTANFTPPTAAYGGQLGNDSYTKLLLHGEGADAATAVGDSSWANPKTVTVNGNAQIDTAQKKFGSASILFDGSGDYLWHLLSLSDSADWNFGTGDFTIDLWVRFNNLPTSGNYMTLVGQKYDSNNGWNFCLYNNSGTYEWCFYNQESGTFTIDARGKTSPGLSTGTWYHMALVRTGNDFKIFQNGVQCGSTTTDTSNVTDFSATLSIGSYGTGLYFDGWMDEIRISKGIARWTTNFTPPTARYS